jgi:hypothetical protein
LEEWPSGYGTRLESARESNPSQVRVLSPPQRKIRLWRINVAGALKFSLKISYAAANVLLRLYVAKSKE